MGSSSRRAKRKWYSREKQKIDKEYDVVLVRSDGGHVSDFESDVSDWSIGWLEPHGPEFLSDGESDKSFTVLVPYGRHYGGMVEDPKSKKMSTVWNFPDSYSDGVECSKIDARSSVRGCFAVCSDRMWVNMN